MKFKDLKNKAVLKESKTTYKLPIKEPITEDKPRNYKVVYAEEKKQLFFK